MSGKCKHHIAEFPSTESIRHCILLL